MKRILPLPRSPSQRRPFADRHPAGSGIRSSSSSACRYDQGDGTVSGYVQVLLGYTLGFAQVLRRRHALGRGARPCRWDPGSDRSARPVKPIRRAEIWPANAGPAGSERILARILRRHYLRLLSGPCPKRRLGGGTRKTDQIILTARRPIRPVPVNVDDAAGSSLSRHGRRNALRRTSGERAYEAIRHSRSCRRNTVPPHGKLNGASDYRTTFRATIPCSSGSFPAR